MVNHYGIKCYAIDIPPIEMDDPRGKIYLCKAYNLTRRVTIQHTVQHSVQFDEVSQTRHV